MRLICPCCQTDFPIEAAINDIAARNAVKRAFSVTPFGDLLISYVQLFKPAQRALAMPRLVKLLDELMPMIQAGRIERNGRIWPAPQEYWRQAFEEMLAKREQLTLPLKSHGYLLTIIAGYADKSEHKAEAKSEDRRAGRTPVGGQVREEATHQEPAQRSPMPASVRQQLGKFKGPVNELSTEGENHG